MRRGPRLLTVAVALCPGIAAAQGSTATSMDGVLQRLVGSWRMVGTVRGRPASYRLQATRVLRGKFVELHMVDVAGSAGYEARVFLGVDSAGPRIIAHWLDNFGAGYSIPHAIGAARGDTIQFTFAYPDGPFRDTFVYDRARARWHFRLESGDSAGAWRPFAEYQVRHPQTQKEERWRPKTRRSPPP
jgi:hypothetical protein